MAVHELRVVFEPAHFVEVVGQARHPFRVLMDRLADGGNPRGVEIFSLSVQRGAETEDLRERLRQFATGRREEVVAQLFVPQRRGQVANGAVVTDEHAVDSTFDRADVEQSYDAVRA